MSTGHPGQPKHPQKRAAHESILPQDIYLTDAEEAALDEIWAQIAVEDPDAAESMRQDVMAEAEGIDGRPGHEQRG